MKREEKLSLLFLRAEKLIKELYPEGKDRTNMADDLTALSVAHLSNYLPEIVPQIRPELARIVSVIVDLEIGLDSNGILPIETKRENSIGVSSNPKVNEGNSKTSDK
jgi:hypothetical protein